MKKIKITSVGSKPVNKRETPVSPQLKPNLRTTLNRPLRQNTTSWFGRLKSWLGSRQGRYTIAFIAIFLFVFVAYQRFYAASKRNTIIDGDGNVVEKCSNILNPKCWANVKPQLKKTDDFTNVLIVGLDTRSSGSGTKLMHTDSIMVASFDHQSQETMLISIPRDFYINSLKTRINAIYALTHQRTPDDPFKLLKEEVGKIIGKPIHYLGVVKFEGVVQLVDKLGGIELCIDKGFVAEYPEGDGYVDVSFDAGCQTLNGYNALVYARFRKLKSGPPVLASDFSRARRQQEVVAALKQYAERQDLSVGDRISTYKDLYDGLKEVISFDIGAEDIAAVLSFYDTADRDPMSVILDPYFGGLNKLIKENSSYDIIPIDPSYNAIKSELGNIWDYSEFYREKPTVIVRNYTGAPLPADHPVREYMKNAKYIGSGKIIDEKLNTAITGVQIYDYLGGEKSRSLKKLMTDLGIAEQIATLDSSWNITKTKNDEEIVIFVGQEVVEVTGAANP